MKNLLIFLLICSCFFSFIPANAADYEEANIKLYLDDKLIKFQDQGPVIKNSRALIPVRTAAEALGASIFWVESEKKIIISGEDKIAVMFPWRDTVNVLYTHIDNGVGGGIRLSVAPEIINSRVMVPVRALAQIFGCLVYWDEKNSAVKLYSENYKSSIVIKNNDEINNFWKSVKEEIAILPYDDKLPYAGYFTVKNKKVAAAFKVYDSISLLKAGLKFDSKEIKWFCMYKSLEFLGSDFEKELLDAIIKCEVEESDVGVLSAKGFCIDAFNRKFDNYRFAYTDYGVFFTRFNESNIKDNVLWQIKGRKAEPFYTFDSYILDFKIDQKSEKIAVGCSTTGKIDELYVIEIKKAISADILPYIKRWLENLKDSVYDKLYVESFKFEGDLITAEVFSDDNALSGTIKYNMEKGETIFVE